MHRLSRPTALKIAAVLSFAVGVFGLIFTMPGLARGAEAVNSAADSVPFEILVIAFVFSIIRIVAAPGVWQMQRWGIVLTVIVTALDTLAAAPGILFGPTSLLKLAATFTVVSGIAILILCLWRDPQRTTV